MGKCGRAVAAAGLTWLNVQVVRERTALLGDVGELDIILNTNTAGTGLGRDGALDIALERPCLEEGLGGQGSDVGDTRGVSANHVGGDILLGESTRGADKDGGRELEETHLGGGWRM